MYATESDIVKRYGQDALDLAFARAGDLANPAAVSQALDDASDEIDTYLMGRYSLPLDPVPPVLTRLCVDMALYHGSDLAALTDERRTRYEDAVALLTRISEGKVSLEGVAGQTPASSGASFVSNDRIFGRGSMQGGF